jgi:hypothetical protein
MCVDKHRRSDRLQTKTCSSCFAVVSVPLFHILMWFWWSTQRWGLNHHGSAGLDWGRLALTSTDPQWRNWYIHRAVCETHPCPDLTIWESLEATILEWQLALLAQGLGLRMPFLKVTKAPWRNGWLLGWDKKYKICMKEILLVVSWTTWESNNKNGL